MEIIWFIIVGAIVGALGRLINPGPDPMGWIVTLLIGIAALVIVGLIVDSLLWGIILGAIIAAVLVTLVQRFLPGSDRRARAV
jgi:uncharacterized membrane protein YeaQ/YmgE (transglycosylase-associated protein family)